eukprot:4008994-Pyramimonas_sp.AAC.1
MYCLAGAPQLVQSAALFCRWGRCPVLSSTGNESSKSPGCTGALVDSACLRGSPCDAATSQRISTWRSSSVECVDGGVDCVDCVDCVGCGLDRRQHGAAVHGGHLRGPGGALLRTPPRTLLPQRGAAALRKCCLTLRIYPCFLHTIGPSCEYTRASCI